jgi:L-alanine-DL-glutamate epimerase-like enolase superfamily enzyme
LLSVSEKNFIKLKENQINKCSVNVYVIPTDLPESDGTFEWNSTTLVLVTIAANNVEGLGYTYSSIATARLIEDILFPVIKNKGPLNISGLWTDMVRAIRNLGRPGISSMAISAVDNALWDLKAKLLNCPLADLLGRVKEKIPVYGSGGFISYSNQQLEKQFSDWALHGIKRMKMKIGRDENKDKERIKNAREAIGNECELFIDANGAYTVKQALRMAEYAALHNVTWFEEPVSSDNLEGLAFIRANAPPGMDITAGEYGFDQTYFKRMLEAQAVDVLQLDATRCAGISGLMDASALSKGFHIPNSAHTAPSVHIAPCCALTGMEHIEYFHDHSRIEKLLFEGTVIPEDGCLAPDLSLPGIGLVLKNSDAKKYEVNF